MHCLGCFTQVTRCSYNVCWTKDLKGELGLDERLTDT